MNANEENFQNFSLTSFSDHRYLVGSSQRLYYMDLLLDSIIFLPESLPFLHYDVEVIDGRIFAANTFYFLGWPPTAVVELDPASGAVTDTLFMLGSLGLAGKVSGITAGFSPDCGSKNLYLSLTDTSVPPTLNTSNAAYLEIDNNFEVNLICQGTSSAIDAGILKSISSWERHREVCELRLDLDADDSGGRVGSHYQDLTVCPSAFSIADDDVVIWTVDDRPIDSMHIRLAEIGNPLAEYSFQFEANQNFMVIEADTLLRIFPREEGLSYTDWTTFTGRIALGVNGIVEEAHSLVESQLFAANLASYPAKSFFLERPPYAGRDTTLEVCRSFYHDLLREALPDAQTSGRWEPNLPLIPSGPEAGRPAFNSALLPHGSIMYIVEAPNCPNDTAVVVTIPEEAQAAANIPVFDTVFLCEGNTFNWNPAWHPSAVLQTHFGLPFPDFQEPVRPISSLGVYSALIDYSESGSGNRACYDFITLTVLPNELEAIPVAIDTQICPGYHLELGGQVFTEPGVYEFTGPGNGCDTSYHLQLSWLEEPTASRREVLCDGQTYEVANQVFTSAGIYSVFKPGVECDTLITLELLAAAPDSIQLYTSICFGDTLFVAGQGFTEAGQYSFQTSGGEADCGQMYDLNLVYRFHVDVDVDTSLLESDSLVFQDRIIYEAGNYVLVYPATNGCDSIVKLSVQLISAVINRGGDGSARYRIVNPIPQLAAFRVIDSQTG